MTGCECDRMTGAPLHRRRLTVPRFAANLAYLFTERPLLQRFAAAAAAGFKAVELQCPYDQPAAEVKAEIERHGLTMLGINTGPGKPPRGASGVGAIPGREDEFRALLEQALDYVTAIGGCQIHCMAGTIAPEQRSHAEDTFIRNLEYAAKAAGERNITILIEPLNPYDRPDYFLFGVEQAAGIVRKMQHPNVRIQFDFYHNQIVGGDLMRRFESHLPLIGHVQIAAVPSRQEPDEGEINYPAILEMLDRLGYRGWVGCEYHPRGKTEEGLGWARPFGIGV
jgi:hydroxypyruvate isomerase